MGDFRGCIEMLFNYVCCTCSILIMSRIHVSSVFDILMSKISTKEFLTLFIIISGASDVKEYILKYCILLLQYYTGHLFLSFQLNTDIMRNIDIISGNYIMP